MRIRYTVLRRKIARCAQIQLGGDSQFGCRDCGCVRFFCCDRQQESKGGPHANLAFDADPPAMFFDDIPAHRQPQSGATLAACIGTLLGTVESIKDLGQFFLWNAGTTVANRKIDRSRCFVFRNADGNVPALPDCLACISQQVQENLLDLVPADIGRKISVTSWEANVPCCSCFIPFYIQGSRMPECVDKAGKSQGKLTDATRTTTWGYTPDSYWWQFDKLRMLVNSDRRRPWEKVIEFGFRYHQRQPAVRAQFDALEQAFIAGDWKVRACAKELIDARKVPQATALLDEYSARCSQAALARCKSLIHYFENTGG